MTQTIHRMYATADVAAVVVKDLMANGFDGDEVHVVGHGDFEPGKNSSDEVVTAITKGNVLRADAVILAEGIQKGGTLVTVHAVFGAAVKALDILDSHGPVSSGLPSRRHPAPTWDEAAPLSSAIMMPVALDDPTIFATYSGLPTLLDSDCSASACVGMPLLNDSKFSLSAMFGMPLLSNNSTPLSSMFKIPLLSGH